MIDKCEICGKEATSHVWDDKNNKWIERCNRHWNVPKFECCLDKWMGIE